MRVNEYIAQGMTPDDARRLAAQRFGSVDRARDACVVINEQHARSEGRAQSFSTLHQDATFATRLIRRHLLQSVVAAHLSRARDRRDDDDVQRRNNDPPSTDAIPDERARRGGVEPH